ncbi:MAG TPA: DUF2950 domain-containing protein [Steroidobacteraceae bacterium]|nr:DUF2950 domain-containing protein [Steroidobacteraceae bacterium]
MNPNSIRRGLAVVALLCCGHSVLALDTQQKTFATPEDAVVALVDADKAGDAKQLHAIFGPLADKVMVSGDPVMDQRSREVFLVAYAERAALMTVSPTREILYIGNEDWPFPIPLLKEGQEWRFDTATGAQEILFRRIGRNELTTIQFCQAYIDAQQDYAGKAHDGKPAGVYSQKLASTPGKQDGLYWKSEDPEQLSPLGEFAAQAASEGYRRSEGQPTPYHGYFFRILTGEGASAKGAARSYVVNGEMRDGFALIAYPAVYGSSGVMSFIVNQDGVVYQKDLGPETTKIAGDISQFNADSSWQKAE